MQAHNRSLPAEQVVKKVFVQFDTNYREGRLQNPTLPARLVVNLICTDATGEVISIYDARGKELLSLATIPRGIDSHRFPGELSQRGRQGFCGSRCLWCEKMLGWGD